MKLPFVQLFTGDWLKDPAVSALSPAARGIWFDLICVMHEAGRSGVIAGNRAALSRLARCSTDELGSALNEFQMCGTCDIEESNAVVTVTNRRMKREADQRKQGAERVADFRERQAGNAPVTERKRPILQSAEFRNSDKACKPQGGGGEAARGDARPTGGLTARQIEVIQFSEETLNGGWVNDAGKWVTRIKGDAEKVWRVMADVSAAKREGRVKTTPAQMAEFNWGVFK